MIASDQERNAARAKFAAAQEQGYLPKDATLTFWFESVAGWVARIWWWRDGQVTGYECGDGSLVVAVTETMKTVRTLWKPSG